MKAFKDMTEDEKLIQLRSQLRSIALKHDMEDIIAELYYIVHYRVNEKAYAQLGRLLDVALGILMREKEDKV